MTRTTSRPLSSVVTRAGPSASAAASRPGARAPRPRLDRLVDPGTPAKDVTSGRTTTTRPTRSSSRPAWLPSSTWTTPTCSSAAATTTCSSATRRRHPRSAARARTSSSADPSGGDAEQRRAGRRRRRRHQDLGARRRQRRVAGNKGNDTMMFAPFWRSRRRNRAHVDNGRQIPHVDIDGGHPAARWSRCRTRSTSACSTWCASTSRQPGGHGAPEGRREGPVPEPHAGKARSPTSRPTSRRSPRSG